VAVSGGRGTLAGSLIGVALLSSITPALVFLGTNPHLAFLGATPQWEKAVQGLIILLAVTWDSLYRPGRWHERARLARVGNRSVGVAPDRACAGDSGCTSGARNRRLLADQHQFRVAGEWIRGPAPVRRDRPAGDCAHARDHQRRH